MGSCFSKCTSKKTISQLTSPPPLRFHDHVQEKSVITQSVVSRPTLTLPAAPPFPSKSTSFSSYCSDSSHSRMTTSCSSNSSSTLTSKDRSYSNEFLWSCARENLHVIKPSSPVKPVGSVTVLEPPVKQIIPEKRARPGSPNLSRQKTFRADPCDFSYGQQRMAAPSRSPSASTTYERDLRRSSSPHYIPRTNYPQTSLRKQSTFRSASPNHNISRRNNWGNKQCSMAMGSPLLCPKADRLAVRSVISGRADTESAEDVDNPLISLDCFIFL